MTTASLLKPLKPAALVGDKLFITAPGHVRGWARERYGELIRRAAREANGGRLEVELVDETWEPPTAAAEPVKRSSPASNVGLNPKYTFEQFVICDGNRFAHAAALAVAEMPGQAYNPLVLHGPPGTGKTHLLHAIGNYIARYGDGLTVRYATVETFTSEFVGAVRSEGAAGFKSRFRGADVLLIDDIQFLASKQRTEEEFFHTFNALYETGRQLVFIGGSVIIIAAIFFLRRNRPAAAGTYDDPKSRSSGSIGGGKRYCRKRCNKCHGST